MCRQDKKRACYHIAKISSLEYEPESETSTGSALPLYTSSLHTPPPASSLPAPINSPPFYNTMSQHDLHAIIHQQQKQLAVMQAQIQALLARGVGRGEEGLHRKVAKPPVLNREAGKISRFMIACKLYIKARIMEVTVEEQVQWVLSFVQGGSANIWKENMLEDLEEGVLEYESVGEFLAAIKKEFEGEEKELVKVAELKKLEQEGRIMEEFVQEFKRATRENGYEERPLVEEFKRGISRAIKQKLMEAERPPTSIKQWYECTTNLNRHWRESKREKEQLRGRREQEVMAPKQQQQQAPQPQVWKRRQEMP